MRRRFSPLQFSLSVDILEAFWQCDNVSLPLPFVIAWFPRVCSEGLGAGWFGEGSSYGSTVSCFVLIPRFERNGVGNDGTMSRNFRRIFRLAEVKYSADICAMRSCMDCIGPRNRLTEVVSADIESFPRHAPKVRTDAAQCSVWSWHKCVHRAVDSYGPLVGAGVACGRSFEPYAVGFGSMQ